MFLIEQITSAHSKVKSGADFPSYIRDIKRLGVSHYIAYVSDGRIDYFAANNCTVKAPAKYAQLEIGDTCKIELFKAELEANLQGKTHYAAFVRMCAIYGIEKLIVR